MSRSRKIFLFFVGVFVIAIGWLVFDISTRTTFPGARHPKDSTKNKVGIGGANAVRR